ncbi:MAG: MFS transporter [Iphinoe sp. HA4291-MV1]|jgi:MFS family permease|nr:MFS transporter [Iphinoe sp. HA4291-MV1]
MRTFIILWFGQLVSLLGIYVTGYALNFWIFKNTHSATQFALISLFTLLPAIIIAPLAGTLGDRWDKRSIMILSNFGAGLSLLSVALLLFFGRLEIWHIYLATVASNAFSVLQWPAYEATIAQIVPAKHLVRANGMFQLGISISQLIAPALAGFLLVIIEIKGVFILNGISFLFCLVMLLLVRLPKLQTTTKAQGLKSLVWRDALVGWNYIRTRPGLFWLLILMCIYHFVEGISIVLSTPMFLSFTSTAVLGTMLSIAGSGMLLGTALISSWGGGKRRIYTVLGFTLLSGLCMVLVGLRPDVLLCTVAAFLHFFSLPIIVSARQAIFQSKVLPDVQGRVFAVNRMLINVFLLLSYVVSGPLADNVFNPLLVTNGLLAGSIGKIIGVGPGRGIGLLFIVVGTLMTIVTITSYLSPRLRRVELELPNVISYTR